MPIAVIVAHVNMIAQIGNRSMGGSFRFTSTALLVGADWA